MQPTTPEKGHTWQATVGTTLTRRFPMGTVRDRGVRSPRYPSTMPKSLRHPRDKVCWLDPFLLCLVPRRRFGSLRSLVQLPMDAKLLWLVSLDSRRQSCEVCPPSCDNIRKTSLHCVSLTSDILCSRRFDARAGGGHFSLRHFPPSGNERGGDFQTQKTFSDICLQSVQ